MFLPEGGGVIVYTREIPVLGPFDAEHARLAGFELITKAESLERCRVRAGCVGKALGV